MHDEGRDAVALLEGATLRVHRNAVAFGRLLGMPLVTHSDAPMIGLTRDIPSYALSSNPVRCTRIGGRLTE